MAIAFSHCKAVWSYHGFMDFRKKVARSIGIELSAMEGFSDYGIPWETVHDPIVPFLNHSDCDGVLTPEECAIVAPRLREIVSKWSTVGRPLYDYDYDIDKCIMLADGMQKAAEAHEALRFY